MKSYIFCNFFGFGVQLASMHDFKLTWKNESLQQVGEAVVSFCVPKKHRQGNAERN